MAMFRPRNILTVSSLLFAALSVNAFAETKIVTWNAEAELTESLEERLQDFEDFAAAVDPDVVILVEMNGEQGVSAFVDKLGWSEYYSVTSNLSKLSTSVYFALEVAVVSKIPITSAVEYDTSIDGAHGINVNGVVSPVAIDEVQLRSDGIAHFGDTLASTDRGTIRVDLDNGLTLFPVHLKSNRVSSCGDPKSALKIIKENGFDLPPALQKQLEAAYSAGFPAATRERLSNAAKRERVMAAIVREAEKAVTEGRSVVIAGDFNTAYEDGKVGFDPVDCQLRDFGCEKAPFPASACTGADGFDDTLGILEAGLVGPTKWKVLTKALGRTYDDEAFADRAIDHIAVPEQVASKFGLAARIDGLFGSDHFPVMTVYSD
jgi:endonuclease/exonuclease/phosphatase family metal-dependent hydrolase